MLERVWREGTLLDCWWECKLVQPLWKTLWRFLKKLKIELPFDPAIPLLGIYPEKTMTCKDTCTPIATLYTISKHGNVLQIAALYTIAKTWEQSKCPRQRSG